jgi:serine protease AprX
MPASGIALWEDAGLTFAEAPPDYPVQMGIESAFPNPFSVATTIEYVLDRPATVTLRVYDVLGRTVATLADGSWGPGRHSVGWSRGELPAGVYVLRLQAGRVMRTKMLVISP